MTREEQVKQAAEDFAGVNYDCETEADSFYHHVQKEAFMAGAEYADQNPINYDGKAMLHVLNKGRKIGYKDATERAVEFIYAQQLVVPNIEELINELRKYMEQQ